MGYIPADGGIKYIECKKDYGEGAAYADEEGVGKAEYPHGEIVIMNQLKLPWCDYHI
mgnify:CR=1 FL=1